MPASPTFSKDGVPSRVALSPAAPSGKPSGIPAESPPKSAVLLLNFGGPRNLAEVPRFLFEILRDPNTIQLPAPQLVQDLLAWRVAARRSPEVARQYGEIGGASPIVAATDRMASAVGALLTQRGYDVPVFIAHRYLRGHSRETVARLMDQGVERIVAIPLYPHFSYATTGSSAEQLSQELERAGFPGEVLAVRSYPDAPAFVGALAERLTQTLARAGFAPASSPETVILCSAHGLPANYVERGDPYRLELYRTVDALKERFPTWRFVLSFQSRVGPAKWLEPYTDRILADLAAEGVKHLVFLPLAFVNDHLETLYEIGHTYFGAARALGMTPALVSAIEDHRDFMAGLADWAEAALDGQGGDSAGGSRSPRGAVPLAELLPPDQSFRRVGGWAWGAWLIALAAAVTNLVLR